MTVKKGKKEKKTGSSDSGQSLRFEPEREGLEAMMGPLEARIMDVIWDHEEATIREVWEELSAEEELAYTTVMTIVHRLFEKGYLVREPAGHRSHVYRPSSTREKFRGGVLSRVLKGVIQQVRGSEAVGILGSLPKRDRKLLRKMLEESEEDS